LDLNKSIFTQVD